TPRMMSPQRGQRFADIVRTLQPNTLIDGRLGTEGDYRSTGDNVVPEAASNEAWETPATVNHTWGYRKDDQDWKSAGTILFKLFLPQTEWRVTTKPGKLFITFFNEPRAPFEIPAMKNTIKRAYRLADGAPVELKNDNGKPAINLERPILDPMATVVVVEFDGE